MATEHKCERCGKKPAGELTMINAWYPNFDCEYTDLWLCDKCAEEADHFFVADVLDDL